MNDFHFTLELFGQLNVLYFSLFRVYLVLYDFSVNFIILRGDYPDLEGLCRE